MNCNAVRSHRVVVSLLNVALLLSCGRSDTQQRQVGSTYVKSVDISAAEGGVIVITNDDSPTLAGTRLVTYETTR